MRLRNLHKVGAVCAIAGSVLLLVGTYLHPSQADPNDAVAAFTEYAADHLWVTTHLTQLGGLILISVCLLVLAYQWESLASGWARIAAAGTIASLAVAAVLQAVDGIALKTMVNAWASAPAAQKEIIFHAAFAVRQVEIGLASMTSLLFGITVTVYGMALSGDRTYPKWISGVALMGGVINIAAGVVMAYTGFSSVAMAFSMPAGFILLGWMLMLARSMWHRASAC